MNRTLDLIAFIQNRAHFEDYLTSLSCYIAIKIKKEDHYALLNHP